VLCVLLSALVSYAFLTFLLPIIFKKLENNAGFKKIMLGLAAVGIVYGFFSVMSSLEQAKFATNFAFIAEMEFKILLAVGLMLLVPRLAKKYGFHDGNAVQLALLISTMCFLSVWAFIDGIRLQIPMWPAFITG
jgi:hypothetical protein